MRRNPTEPETRLWARLSRSRLGGFKFRRQATIGHAIVDFLCPSQRLIVEVDGHTHADLNDDARRDTALAAQGYRVVRVSNEDVMRNIEGVLEQVLSALAEMPHPNPSPEGEGLEQEPEHAEN
ncbi:hypothetical protein AWL63_02305 [Sphingomonas panacis]|uniref:DUF559 domain-containing protein n=2 Tax=Sphingomonas panacis TaxID=1560345 RepID=A0A1B3Z6C9_9SPHN|nr:hypothetical protein AWL63_02305 [Sphingomonas panacis]